MGRAQFEKRLSRARPYNRSQYLRIKGLALFEAGEVDRARELWLRVLDSTEHQGGIDRSSALELLGDSYVPRCPTIAVDYFERLLDEHPDLNGKLVPSTSSWPSC